VSLFRRPDSVVDDSPKFNKALRIWSEFLAEHYSSPREIKRFMSFVRYLAMRTRVPEQRFTPLERLINWIAEQIAKAASWNVHRSSEAGDSAKAPDEAAIVTMAALTFGPKPVVKDSGPVDYENLQKTESKTLVDALVLSN
jgi:hypothetical protein